MEKTKDKGNVKRTLKIVANGIQFLNGKECIRHYKVPIIVLDYESPESAKPYAQGERFAFWCKLEEAQYKKVVDQLKPELKELTIWLTEKDKQDLREFMLNDSQNMKENTPI